MLIIYGPGDKWRFLDAGFWMLDTGHWSIS